MASVEPHGALGRVQEALASSVDQRTRLRRRPNGQYHPDPAGRHHAAVPAGRPGPLWNLRPADGILLGPRPTRLPLPPRPHQQHATQPAPTQETSTGAKTTSWPTSPATSGTATCSAAP